MPPASLRSALARQQPRAARTAGAVVGNPAGLVVEVPPAVRPPHVVHDDQRQRAVCRLGGFAQHAQLVVDGEPVVVAVDERRVDGRQVRQDVVADVAVEDVAAREAPRCAPRGRSWGAGRSRGPLTPVPGGRAAARWCRRSALRSRPRVWLPRRSATGSTTFFQKGYKRLCRARSGSARALCSGTRRSRGCSTAVPAAARRRASSRTCSGARAAATRAGRPRLIELRRAWVTCAAGTGDSWTPSCQALCQ